MLFESCSESKLRNVERSFDATPRPKDRLVSIQARDNIPWPALTRLTHGSLKRTTSTLMSEWERSLAPNIHDEADPLAGLASTNAKTD